MGLFSRNKGRQTPAPTQPQQPQQSQQQAQSASQGPVPANQTGPHAGPGTPPMVHPPSFLSTSVPQPQPSPAQYQQELFRQQYDYLNAVQQGVNGQLYPYGPPMPPQGAAAAGMDPAHALLHEAVQQAARDGKPLTLDFVAQLTPVMENTPHGILMPHTHPYGPPYDGTAAGVHPGWYPGKGQNPYEHIKIPALPDMRQLPPELQDFRDQCATGVRQAVAMITAMEHQLWWERSRRQQAEEDCKVLLAAVQVERGLGETLLEAEEKRQAEAVASAGKLKLAADELPQASEAATTIQKHFRGRLARKEYESHLRDILRGVDPQLDPAALPARAQEHISNVNTTGAPRRLGLRDLMDDVIKRSGGGHGGGGSGALPTEQAEAITHYRRQVDRIGQRLTSHKDAGEPHPNDTSGDPLLKDVKDLLSGSYPASSAQVVAALVRRCRELQAALLEAVGELEQAQLTIQGLRDANAKLSELSHVRADLEATRHDNLRLAGTVAKLRTHLTAAAVGTNAGAARENPWVAAWYRKAYAEQEWQKVPPGGPGGIALMDGPDTAVETWDDLRASLPEPVMVPRVTTPGTQYKDLMGLKQDMIQAAQQGPPDPLYSMPVPDRSAFLYERDTPLLPVQTPMPLIRETLPPDTFLGVHDDLYRRTPRPSGPGGGSPAGPHHQTQSYTYGGGGGNLLPSNAINLGHGRTPSGSYGGAGHATAAGAYGSGGGGGGGGAYQQLVDQQERMRQQAAFEAANSGGGGGGGPAGGQQFNYNRDTPIMPVYTVLPLIREDEYIRRSTSPPREHPPPATPQRQSSYAAASQPPSRPGSVRGAPTSAPHGRDPMLYPRPHQQLPPEAVAAAAVALTQPQTVGGGPLLAGHGGAPGGAPGRYPY